jgi:hypothetical protein
VLHLQNSGVMAGEQMITLKTSLSPVGDRLRMQIKYRQVLMNPPVLSAIRFLLRLPRRGL